jgi:hypothetical protein
VFSAFFSIATSALCSAVPTSGRHSLRIASTAACQIFHHCVFDTIFGSDSGGAISYISTNGELEVADCLFHACEAASQAWTDYGGCIYMETSRISIGRTCSSRCRAEEGQAYAYWGPPSVSALVEWNSFVECSFSGDSGADSGAIYCHTNAATAVDSTNFTKCYIYPTSLDQTRMGAAICFYSLPTN